MWNGGDEFVAEHDLIAWPSVCTWSTEKWYSAGPLLWRGPFRPASLDSEGIRSTPTAANLSTEYWT
jgi:hypothetical protein